MTDLDHYIGALNNSANSLKTLYFRPPGVFTNALILKPDITSLLRDADTHENALYQVDNTGKPERRDGTRGVVDRLNDDFEELELQQQLNEEGLAPPSVPEINRPSAVLVPKDLQEAVPDHNKGVKNLLSRFNEENEKDYDVDVLCETITQLLAKYPVEGVDLEIQKYKKKWSDLSQEILHHEETIEKQRRQLSLLNISLNDRGLNTAPKLKTKKTAAELIAQEEEQIRQLELELERKSRDVL